MVTEGEREMSFKKIIHGLLGHSKKFRLNSKCNGKSVKDLKQRSDVIQSSFWLLLFGEYTRGVGRADSSGETMWGCCRNPGRR